MHVGDYLFQVSLILQWLASNICWFHFQILLRNRSTNLNAKTHDGTTPMILAARLAIEGLVEELINADADINAMDEYGTTEFYP